MFVVLLILDISLIVTVFHLIDNNRKLKLEYNNIGLELRDARLEQELILQHQIDITGNTIDSVLLLTNNPFPHSDKRIICMFVPPYPCSACFERETRNFKSFLHNQGGMVISPEYRIGDIKIQYADFKNITIVSYDADKLKNEALRNLDQMVYFTLFKGKEDDLFITAKNTPDASQWYLTRASH